MDKLRVKKILDQTNLIMAGKKMRIKQLVKKVCVLLSLILVLTLTSTATPASEIDLTKEIFIPEVEVATTVQTGWWTYRLSGDSVDQESWAVEIGSRITTMAWLLILMWFLAQM